MNFLSQSTRALNQQPLKSSLPTDRNTEWRSKSFYISLYFLQRTHLKTGPLLCIKNWKHQQKRKHTTDIRIYWFKINKMYTDFQPTWHSQTNQKETFLIFPPNVSILFNISLGSQNYPIVNDIECRCHIFEMVPNFWPFVCIVPNVHSRHEAQIPR